MDSDKIKKSNYVSFVWQQCQLLWEYGGGGVKDDHWFLITRQPDPSPRWILWFVNPAVPTNKKTISLPLPPSPDSLLRFRLCEKHFLSLYLSPESIEWYTEDQAFLQSLLTPRPPNPTLPSATFLSFSVFLCVADEAYWRKRGGGERVFKEPNHSTTRKPGSIIYSILFASLVPAIPEPFWDKAPCDPLHWVWQVFRQHFDFFSSWQPYVLVDKIPHSGTKNLASGLHE